jgi:hypothetical protein
VEMAHTNKTRTANMENNNYNNSHVGGQSDLVTNSKPLADSNENSIAFLEGPSNNPPPPKKKYLFISLSVHWPEAPLKSGGDK